MVLTATPPARCKVTGRTRCPLRQVSSGRTQPGGHGHMETHDPRQPVRHHPHNSPVSSANERPDKGGIQETHKAQQPFLDPNSSKAMIKNYL